MTNLSLQFCENTYIREFQTARKADKLRTHVLGGEAEVRGIKGRTP